MSDGPSAWRAGSIQAWRPRTLRQKQTLFLQAMSALVQHAHGRGWELTPSDFAVDQKRILEALDMIYPDKYYPPKGGRLADLRLLVGHRLDGCHAMKIAGDVNLFLGGRIQAKHCPEWDVLGLYWKSLNPLCRWGGDFASGDYNHFSITHEGRS